MVRHKVSWPVWLRRLSQTCFMLLFLYLFLKAVYLPVNETGRHVKLFFQLDPLILLTTLLSSHQILSGLLLSLVTLAVTVFFGRWFCGWVCPFGALHNLFSGWRGQKTKEKMAGGGYSPWQKTKYYVLAAVLVAALLGLNLAGLLDPFSLLYRSVATVVNPVLNDSLKAVFGWIYQTDPGIANFKVTTVSEPVYEFLRRTILATAQPFFYGTLLMTLVFVGAVMLNLFRARFWCRYICPLGALLGVAGKNPLVKISRNTEQCNNCRLCVADCQGGANPDVTDGWKPSECFYCYNCQSACPHKAISFRIQVPGGKR